MTLLTTPMLSPFYPDEVSVGEVIYPPGGRLGPRTQINLQLVMLYRGTMTVWVDDVPLYAQAGSVTLLLPIHQEYFEFAADTETEHRWLHFYTETFPPILETRMSQLPPTMSLSSEMDNLIERALRLQRSSLSTADMLLRALALQMVWLYIGEGEQMKATGFPFRSGTIELAIEYIHKHLKEDIQLKEIAYAAAVSENHLIRLFKRHLNTTPIEYLWNRRITHAVDLLQRTGLSIGQVASESGFKTSYHFSRRIREVTGFTPTQLRSRSWG